MREVPAYQQINGGTNGDADVESVGLKRARDDLVCQVLSAKLDRIICLGEGSRLLHPRPAIDRDQPPRVHRTVYLSLGGLR